jgi:hypothetical protein
MSLAEVELHIEESETANAIIEIPAAYCLKEQQHAFSAVVVLSPSFVQKKKNIEKSTLLLLPN